MLFRPAVVFPLLTAMAALIAPAAEETTRPWNHEILYSVLIDRFFDGDPTNNVPADSDPALFDKTQQDINKYHGGDLRGLETAIQRGYFKDLGVTTLAISPPVKNVWYSQGEAPAVKTGYAGDWAQDFADIDPHWTSAKSADGETTYQDSRDGRMQYYKDFVALAHAAGIRVVQDVVLNHAGPVFFYDLNGNGQFDVDSREEWAPPYNAKGAYENAAWCELPKWNALKTAPGEPVTVLGRELKIGGALASLSSYGKRGFSEDALGKDEDGKHCDVFSRRDLNTTPGTEHFDQLVNDFVEIYAFYIEEIGVDGLRADLLKQTHRAFWDAFTARLRLRIGADRAKELILIGHVNDTDAAEVAKYTVHKDAKSSEAPTFDTVVNTPLIPALREYLRPVIGPYGKASAFEKGLARPPKVRAKRDADGLSARQKLVNQIEGHDGMNRFRVPPVSEKQNTLANALILFNEGIPCLYYGTEAGLNDASGKINKDSQTGRLTLISAGSIGKLDEIRKSPSFQSIASLIALRKQLAPLRDGAWNSLWSDSSAGDADDGVFGFVRYIRTEEDEDAPADVTIVMINASERPRSTSAGTERLKLLTRGGKPLLNEGQKLVRLPVAGLDAATAREQFVEVPWHDGKPQVELILAPQTVNVYRVGK
ncbi:MAG TPA: alpha-amylase family glycosyl hydrolase [Chthoniobacteraceae bacterium]|nr:alpha-amylase family glycosyl hydrolase [Chthoniobacteraceae bacterium]